MAPLNAAYIDDPFEYDWAIETTSGEITFKSVGFRQFIKANPILIKRQNLSLKERRGYLLTNEIAT